MAKQKSKTATPPKSTEEAEKKKDPTVVSDVATDQVVTNYPEGAVPSELFPQRRAVDVDVADIENPDKKHKGETHPPLNAETWVVLDGSHKDVPKELDGKVGAVIDWPTTEVVDEDTGERRQILPPKAAITVKMRAQGQILHLTMDAFKEVHTNGRASVLDFA